MPPRAMKGALDADLAAFNEVRMFWTLSYMG